MSLERNNDPRNPMNAITLLYLRISLPPLIHLLTPLSASLQLQIISNSNINLEGLHATKDYDISIKPTSNGQEVRTPSKNHLQVHPNPTLLQQTHHVHAVHLRLPARLPHRHRARQYKPLHPRLNRPLTTPPCPTTESPFSPTTASQALKSQE